MNRRKRTIIAGLWVAVAGVMALSLEPGVPSTASEVVRVFVILMALGLASLYAFDPKGLLSRTPFDDQES